jgi:hypothetical protein
MIEAVRVLPLHADSVWGKKQAMECVMRSTDAATSPTGMVETRFYTVQ